MIDLDSPAFAYLESFAECLIACLLWLAAGVVESVHANLAVTIPLCALAAVLYVAGVGMIAAAAMTLRQAIRSTLNTDE